MRTFIVDSFTEVPFRGNPAGVCLVKSALRPDQMLQIAQELNLSETAFVQPTDRADAFDIRFFSPKTEIPLCGHATLASARVVFETLGLEEVHLWNVQKLDLVVRDRGDSIEMELPAYGTRPMPVPPEMLTALGIPSVENSEYNEETGILLLEIRKARDLAGLAPDFGALYRSHTGINGVLVTAPSQGDGYDFHSRYFWPWSGTNEDPVTGGTHTFLTGYWSSRLGKTRLRSFQSSERTGSMEVELVGRTVKVRAQAVVVLEGALRWVGSDVEHGAEKRA